MKLFPMQASLPIFNSACCSLLTKPCCKNCNPMAYSPSGSAVHGFPGKDTGVGCHCLYQGIFLTQGSNWRLLHWQEPLSHHRSHINSINPIKSLKDKMIPGCNTKTAKKGKYLRITEMCLKWLCLEVKHKNQKENIEFFDTKNQLTMSPLLKKLKQLLGIVTD